MTGALMSPPSAEVTKPQTTPPWLRKKGRSRQPEGSQDSPVTLKLLRCESGRGLEGLRRAATRTSSAARGHNHVNNGSSGFVPGSDDSGVDYVDVLRQQLWSPHGCRCCRRQARQVNVCDANCTAPGPILATSQFTAG